MTTKTNESQLQRYVYKRNKLIKWGFENKCIGFYDDELIKKLRNIYYGGIPASIILLSQGLCRGNCYDRALLLARAFLDEEDDVNLIDASIDRIRLNSETDEDNDPLRSEHCIVERITKDGEHIIYDTTSGLMYKKELYWLMEHPKVRMIKDKQSIIEHVAEEERREPEDLESGKYAAVIILPILEESYPHEKYAQLRGGLLQREIEHYKAAIDFDTLYKETEEEIEKLDLTSELFEFIKH